MYKVTQKEQFEKDGSEMLNAQRVNKQTEEKVLLIPYMFDLFIMNID